MSFQWQAVAAFTGLLTGTTAIVALILSERRSRVALQTDLLLKHYASFYCQEMRELRQVAARKLLAGETPNYELEDVLDYFGILGALLERGVLDYEVMQGIFDWWILRWWFSAEKYIQARRMDARDPDVEMWFYLEGMVRRLKTHQNLFIVRTLSPEALERFLEEESRSLVHSPTTRSKEQQ